MLYRRIFVETQRRILVYHFGNFFNYNSNLERKFNKKNSLLLNDVICRKNEIITKSQIIEIIAGNS